jgi:aspartokinase
MAPQTRLGAFKILKEVEWISLNQSKSDHEFSSEFFYLTAREKINLPFLTFKNEDSVLGLNVIVDSHNAQTISSLIENNFGKINYSTAKAAILSIFPHKSNPEIIGGLLEVFGKEGIEPMTLANSPSAISIVLKEDLINKASAALFDPFSFSAYRTPSDWKAVQKGKEKLYKEVVASYQEKRPKVYALEWQDQQDLLHVKLKSLDLAIMGATFKDFAQMGLLLTFLISGLSQEMGKTDLVFCLPQTKKFNYADMIRKLLPEDVTVDVSNVAYFSMNGPHFGDRYGIVRDLLNAFINAKIELSALSCSIASITGVLPAEQIHSAIQAIQGCFEVPSVIKKT